MERKSAKFELSPAEFRAMALGEIDSLYRMAMHLSHRPDLAEELVQETYLRALSARRTFRLTERGIRPWLFKILHNAFFAHANRQRRQPLPLDDARDVVPAIVAVRRTIPCDSLMNFDWDDVDQRIRRALDALPLQHRAVLLLWAVEGLKYRQIASVLGIAIGTVMSRLHRARVTLTAQLADLAVDYGLGPSLN